MARSPRIQFAGAVYHIISRGNYRKDLFTVGDSGKAFEKALFEACERCQWKLHAYVIMSNHYHLLLETPSGNLVEGMRWLQGTFGNRFNRFNGGQGHVFQSRYKSLLVENGAYFLGLADYIHLNPVRAGIVDIGNLSSYLLSSYPKFCKGIYPGFLTQESFLAEAGLPDSKSGMIKYSNRLSSLDEADPKKRDDLYKQYQKGMVIGSPTFAREMGKTFSEMKLRKDWGGDGLRELNELNWEQLVKRLLEEHGKVEENILEDRKSADWKIAIAKEMRATTSVTNPWLSQRLNMGHPTAVSKYVSSKY